MKYITVKLTEDQALKLNQILETHISDSIRNANRIEMAINPDYLAFVRRIQTKLAKAKS